MKTSLLTLPAVCCALALGASARAESHVSVDLGLRIGPPPPVVIHRAPPRRVEERITVSPGPGYVWVAGHQTWRNGDWVWMPGMWVRPPQPSAAWVESRWDDRSQTWVDGYWSVPSAPMQDRSDRVVYEQRDDRRANDDRRGYDDRRDRNQDDEIAVEAPPPPRHEVRIGPPGPQYVWIEGYWVRRRHRYEWVQGRWELPPRGHGRWEGPRWERRGGSYVFIQGSWR
ncbi:MAG: hypothetical protein JWM88_36 [Verrucomicrobia bacterium]|nr:hypothetical protein [Verrucomicrobiota bacterium]